MVPILQEFYASLQDEESRKVDGRTWETILDMFGLTYPEQEGEEQNSKEEEGTKEGEEDDEMDFEEDD
ncbi:hypothetical protein Gohar_004603 [Gossypium harknessii]|uniref:Uncharacterized protein n=1 Tax=Gossypium harknessii TaxID=34285 RepID=A0A7J9H618_9ROSI|nr:hypothetical protein [Gossypium harknessii]